MKKFRKIYLGERDSVAGIPIETPIDSNYKFHAELFSVSYDAINDILLTKIPGVYKESTPRRVQRKFSVLKILSNKKFPKLKKDITYLESLALGYKHGLISKITYLKKIRECAKKNKLHHKTIEMIERKIKEAENEELIKRRIKKINNKEARKNV